MMVKLYCLVSLNSWIMWLFLTQVLNLSNVFPSRSTYFLKIRVTLTLPNYGRSIFVKLRLIKQICSKRDKCVILKSVLLIDSDVMVTFEWIFNFNFIEVLLENKKSVFESLHNSFCSSSRPLFRTKIHSSLHS